MSSSGVNPGIMSQAAGLSPHDMTPEQIAARDDWSPERKLALLLEMKDEGGTDAVRSETSETDIDAAIDMVKAAMGR